MEYIATSFDVTKDKDTDRLDKIKEKISESYLYFKPNYESFYKWYRFTFVSTLSSSDIRELEKIQQPTIQCNLAEAYLNRLIGEFSSHEPSAVVGAENERANLAAQVRFVEDHIRQAEEEARNDSTAQMVFKDLCGGGFSAYELYTKYKSAYSFDVVPGWCKVNDPTLCGWDPLATLPHKGDGNYAWQFIPMEEKAIKKNWPKANLDTINNKSKMEDVPWKYTTKDGETIYYICKFYSKRSKPAKLVKLSDGQEMLDSEYKKMLNAWDFTSDDLPPTIATERDTEIETIWRDVLLEGEILESEETIFSILPIVFVDCNSAKLKLSRNGLLQQITRPPMYNALGIQKLLDATIQSIADEITNTIKSKWVMPVEGILDGYLDAYKRNEIPSVLPYRQFYDAEGVPADTQLNPPTMISRPPMPPELWQTVELIKGLFQSVTGSYDAQLGINGNQLSGSAIQKGAMQSNAASLPIMLGYLDGLTRILQGYVDLLPKVFVSPRTIPIKGLDGKKGVRKIYGEDDFKLDYQPGELKVKVEAGVNYQVQKDIAFQTIILLMQNSPTFSQFINTEGLRFLLDNVNMRGIESLKEAADKYMLQLKQQQQQQAQMQQQAVQNDPRVMHEKLEVTKFIEDVKQNKFENFFKIVDLVRRLEEDETERLKIAAEIGEKKTSQDIEKLKSASNLEAKLLDIANKRIEKKVDKE